MRSDYKICPFCGATLDSGEKCDCIKKNIALEHENGHGLENTPQEQTKITNKLHTKIDLGA